MYRRIAAICLIAGAGVLLGACSSYHLRSLDMRRFLVQGQTELALQQLEMERHGGRDQVVYDLNKAMLLHLTGDFAGSNEHLEQAKQNMQQLAATSISENIASVTINEAARSYAGRPYEQLLLHIYKTLNYLLLGDLAAARVEVLQADVKIREWQSAEEEQGVLASAFMRYLSALVFEMNREWDDALIAYRKACEVYRHYERPVPLQLQRDLLRLTEYRDLHNEHKQYRESFQLGDWESMSDRNGKAELVIVVSQGLVSALQEAMVYNYSPELKYQILIALPGYAPRSMSAPLANIQIDDRVWQAEVMEDIDLLARTDLQARLPGITARAVARQVVKKKMAAQARNDNPLAGLFMDVAGLATERADTRGWISLPETLQLLRMTVPAGTHHVTVNSGRPGVSGGIHWQQSLSVKANETVIISVHDMAGRAAYARY